MGVLFSISDRYNLNYDKYYEIGLCLSNLNNSIEEVAQEGLKKYCFNNIKVKSSYIQINEKIDMYKFVNFIQKNLIEEDIKLWVFLVYNLKYEETIEYRITKTDIDSIVYNKIASRGTTIIPYIEKNIKSIIK